MNEQIREHVNQLLVNAPQTRRIDELREELISGCLDKYEDLVRSGSSEEDAFRAVIAGIGDVDELVKELTQQEQFIPGEAERNRVRRAALIGLGVALYIVALASLVLFDWIGLDELGMVSMFTIAGIATFIIIFSNMAIPKTTYQKKEDTLVEDLKVSMAESGNYSKQAKLRSAVSSSLWSLIVVIYLFLSFITNLWYITWLIFILGATLQCVVTMVFTPAGFRGKSINGILWTGMIFIYLLLSFTTNMWHITWIIFLIAVALQQVTRLIRLWNDFK